MAARQYENNTSKLRRIRIFWLNDFLNCKEQLFNHISERVCWVQKAFTNQSKYKVIEERRLGIDFS